MMEPAPSGVMGRVTPPEVVQGGIFENIGFLESLPPGRCVFKPLAAEVLRMLVREQLARA